MQCCWSCFVAFLHSLEPPIRASILLTGVAVTIECGKGRRRALLRLGCMRLAAVELFFVIIVWHLIATVAITSKITIRVQHNPITAAAALWNALTDLLLSERL